MHITDAHVLIIDDNRMNIRVVEGLMRTYGVKVSYALSGQDGIDMLHSRKYDLVFLDHMMPGMDGIETFHHIRRKPDPYFKEIPIIALTANAIAGAREMFIKEGFNDFLAKPVESSVLQRTLKRHIPLHKQKRIEEKEQDEKARCFEEKDHANSLDVSFGTKDSGSSPEVVPAIKSEPDENVFVIGDLDIGKGLMYCGNKENYLEILTSQRDSGKELLDQAQNFFEKEDWKNYTIVVHGIKSSMMSIGAVPLSEMAKALEFAGKGEDYSYIQKEHKAMTEEFLRVMKLLDECSYLTPKEKAEEVVLKPAISEEEFEAKLVELENVTYEFDAGKMLPILDVLSRYSYKEKDLAKELKPVYKKVEMFDFMSAYEAVVKIKEKA